MSDRTKELIGGFLGSLLIAGCAGLIVSWWDPPGWAIVMTVLLTYVVVIGRGNARV